MIKDELEQSIVDFEKSVDEKTKNELTVHISNKLNSYNFRGLTYQDSGLLAYVYSQFVDNDVNVVCLPYKEIRKHLDLDWHFDNSKFPDWIKQFQRNLTSSFAEFQYENGVEDNMPLFSLIRKVPEKEEIIFVVNPILKWYFQATKKGQYTTFFLDEFLQIRSLYSRRLYTFLKQWRFNGAARITLENFKKRMDCENYNNYYNIKQKVINKGIEDLKPYFPDLKVKEIKEGRKVVSLLFTFTPESMPKDKEYNIEPFAPNNKKKNKLVKEKNEYNIPYSYNEESKEEEHNKDELPF